MKDKLLIIESPNKIKTLSKYLGSDFEVMATVGHIRDLSKFGLGFDTKTFEPKWTIINPEKKELINEMNQKAHKAKKIYIATDPDREGEAIAWHIYEVLDDKDKSKCKRITFNEITKQAVNDSFNNKRDINEEWVKSQFTRRIIDRLIGFKLSQLIKSKLKAESAGRVQSVALKFIAEREEEINKFVPTKWWTIDAIIVDDITLNLKELNPKFKYEEQIDVSGSNFKFKSIQEAEDVSNSLSNKYKLINISDPTQIKSSPKKPYKTSTLQQDSINRLNMSAKQTTAITQRLYEGIDVDGTFMALITYPRTDSIRMADSFIDATTKYINGEFGKDYVGNYENNKPTDKNVQDAHEAIRPVDISITPDSLKGKIPKKEFDLYKLIWQRTISSLMSDAKYERITYTFDNNQNIFETSSKVCIFDGYQKVWKNEDDEEKTIKKNLFQLNKEYEETSRDIKEHQTSPPPRFTQASLISALEKSGVGRPSTYNTMVNIVLDRNYATLENKAYHVTDMGKKVIEQLDIFFPDEINKEFTKKMEDKLDNIAAGQENWTDWLSKFSPEFQDKFTNAKENMQKVEDEKVGRECPECGHDLVYKISMRYKSKFIGCSNYPECKHTESLKEKSEAKELNIPCPKCGKNVIIRKNKKGSEFIACTGFPKCRYMLDMKVFNSHMENTPNEPLPIIEKESKSKSKK